MNSKGSIEMTMSLTMPLWKLAANGPYVVLAALSGATAVVLGAIGFHSKYIMYTSTRSVDNPPVCFIGNYPRDDVGQEQRRIFEIANQYHFIHTLALLGLPLCRTPFLVC